MHGVVTEYAWKIAMADSQERKKFLKKWRLLDITKHDKQDHFPISKTTGVIFFAADLWQSRFHVNSFQNEYFKEFQKSGEEEHQPTLLDTQEIQEYPPANSKGFITKAVIPQYLNFTIDLFCNHFSQNLRLIFPLMAYKKNKYGLDLRSTETWVSFPEVSGDPLSVKPNGGVYWRLHKPKILHGSGNLELDAGSHTFGILEVLFLAVLAKFRKDNLGGNIVEKLKVVAKENNCPILYVEIGYETPQAVLFWTKQGFKEISSFSFTEAQLARFEHNCLRFNDTVQYICVLDD